MTSAMISALANHLWQSTFFALAAGLLTFAFRKHNARVRYCLWLAASIKFLIPFSLLIGFGARYARIAGPASNLVTAPQLSLALAEVSVPFQMQAASRATADASIVANFVLVLVALLWLTGTLCITFVWLRRWTRIRKIVRAGFPVELGLPVRTISTADYPEPAVFGIIRPVLLLPRGITERLTAPELQAIVVHELCHIRWRDNAAAVAHMLAEALFWFHPLVWWIGSRLVEERERACDEEVVRISGDPRTYAESLVKVCEYYLESRIACIAGVTGSNLKKRLAVIMDHRVPRPLQIGGTLGLAAAALGAIIAPFAFGLLNAPPVKAQDKVRTERLAFEVTSVKPNNSTDFRNAQFQPLPGGKLIIRNVPLLMIVGMAYNVPFQSPRLTGSPEWVRAATQKYDIDGIPPEGAVPAGLTSKERDQRIRLMLQSLLEDRFGLKMTRVAKEQPVYAIGIAKDGPKLEKSKTQEKDCTDAAGGIEASAGKIQIGCHSISGGIGRGIHGDAIDIGDMALFVQNWTDRPVIDKTGLTDLYKIQTEGWTPMRPRLPSPDGQPPQGGDAGLSDPDRPTLADILRKLGLSFESKRAVVDMFVVEHIGQPTAN